MNESDFRDLENHLTSDCERMVQAFSASQRNQDIYAFVLEYDAVNNCLIVKWNDLGSLKALIDGMTGERTETDLNGVFGTRYSTGDFAHEDFPSEATSALLDRFWKTATSHEGQQQEAYFERLREMFVSTIERLRPTFRLFDRIPEFVAFAMDWQRVREAYIPLMRRTIPDDTMFRLFPGLQEAESIREGIHKCDGQEQARLWISELHAYYEGRQTELSSALARSGRGHVEVIIDGFRSLDVTAVSVILGELSDRIDTSVRQAAGDEQSLARFAGDLINHLCYIHRNRGGPVDETIARFREWHELWRLRDSPSNGATLIVYCLARGLHLLAPKEFPRPKPF